MAKVVHVHLFHSIDNSKRKDWYFSSISAVYTTLKAEQVGATKNYLLHAGLSGNGTILPRKLLLNNLSSYHVQKARNKSLSSMRNKELSLNTHL